MRENWRRAAGAAMCIVLLAGCGNEENTSEAEPEQNIREAQQELEEFYIPAAEDEDVPTVISEYAEEAEYPELAAFLGSYYEIPEEYRSETRYYYNYIDLNEDGTDEIVAVVVGDYTEVPFGDPAVILAERDGDFWTLESFEGIHTPVTVSEDMTNGWHDIIYNEYGRGAEDGYRICRYNPNGGYQTELSEVVNELVPAGGTQILSNNFIDDMDRGRYLTLEPQEDVQTDN